jgi:hypothetical protein
MSQSILLQDELPSSISSKICHFVLTCLKKYEIPQNELQLCIVTENPFGTGKLITNINLTYGDYCNWDIVSVSFHKHLAAKSILTFMAMMDIWHPEDDECKIKNRTGADVFKAWIKQFNNEVKKSPLIAIYPIYECSPVEKTARRFLKRIS